VSDYEVKNMFPEIEVLGRKTPDDNYEKNDCIEFIDVKNGKVVLRVGTMNTNGYYPFFEATFTPENMSTNEGK